MLWSLTYAPIFIVRQFHIVFNLYHNCSFTKYRSGVSVYDNEGTTAHKIVGAESKWLREVVSIQRTLEVDSERSMEVVNIESTYRARTKGVKQVSRNVDTPRSDTESSINDTP